ncbi:hypothetical protein BE04_00255 [Sorangium cellulosum]|uniref:Dienelactone hydrolase domain-containing protein n=1 Tax=Sorangium cellulosum TaxID=56 RepID=A0A150PSZ8_SORCE|nr:hypothetical protein BE04_00255 [Sorangium cellulosum]
MGPACPASLGARVAAGAIAKGHNSTEGLTEAKADGQIHAHGHAMHAFAYPGARLPQAGIQYDAAAARRSWAAMRSFLEEVLERRSC